MLREQLQAQINRLTGTKNQSEHLKQTLRFARGALKSTLATNRELAEWIAKLETL
jgi:predicted Zn-dependent peptidase